MSKKRDFNHQYSDNHRVPTISIDVDDSSKAKRSIRNKVSSKPSVTLIRMEQLAPEGSTITNPSDIESSPLKHILRQRQGDRQSSAVKLSQRVQRFYQSQDDLIDGYERAERCANNDQAQQEQQDQQNKQNRRMTNILSRASLAVNIFLFAIKIVAAILSGSLSIISTVIDSAVDLTTSVILFWASRAMKKRDAYLYPQGRTRLEPIAIVILSVIMCAASVLVIYNSIQTIANDVSVFVETNTTKSLSEIDMGPIPISVMCFTVVSKAILFISCFRIKNPTMSALAEDHRNDVFSNLIALGCGLVASYAYKNEIDQRAIVVDPVGAILISIYIIISWIGQAKRQVKRLTGYTANPEFLSQITWVTYHHSPNIDKIDTVRAFHFGTSFLVEIDIVLPENMTVREAHDIAEGLQQKIERLPEVERAFVHVDYECRHKPSDEHKIV